MEWRVFLTTFITIFIAELGDKTQFAAMAAAGKSQNIWPVMGGVILGLSFAGALGVLVGKSFSLFLEPQSMKIISGSLFILVGLWVLIK